MKNLSMSAGLIHALKGLCGSGGRAQRTRAKAIGAINCLSTYEETRPVPFSYLCLRPVD